MSKQMVHQRMAEFRANVLRTLPDAFAGCDDECRARCIAEIERRLDEAIAAAESKYVESMHNLADRGA